eukprot:9473545-Pyramimonas_sp.AAC.1
MASAAGVASSPPSTPPERSSLCRVASSPTLCAFALPFPSFTAVSSSPPIADPVTVLAHSPAHPAPSLQPPPFHDATKAFFALPLAPMFAPARCRWRASAPSAPRPLPSGGGAGTLETAPCAPRLAAPACPTLSRLASARGAPIPLSPLEPACSGIPVPPASLPPPMLSAPTPGLFAPIAPAVPCADAPDCPPRVWARS